MNFVPKRTAAFFEDFSKFMPYPYNEMTLASFILRCKAGKAPPFFKALSQKDRPQWSAESISAFFQRNWAQTHPDLFAALVNEGGFPMPTIPKPARPLQQPRKRKPKGGRDLKRIPMRDPERSRGRIIVNRQAKKSSSDDQ